jgi:hypothetical protein
VSAKDIFHELVKKALQKEQWVITHDPLRFKFGNINFQVDLGAERLEFTQIAVQKYQILLIVYDPVNEEIVRWIR